MKRVVTAVILVPVVVVALFKAPIWLFTLLVFGVAALAAHEYMGIVKAQGFRPLQTISFVLLAVSFASFYTVARALSAIGPFAEHPWDPRPLGFMLGLGLLWSLAFVSVAGPLLLLAAGLTREPLSKTLPDAAVSYIVLPYAGFTLGLLPILRTLWSGPLYLLYLMLLVWCGDIAAYYVGRAIGRHKLAPRVSPGKTWEGAIASVLGAVIVGLVLFHYINPIIRAIQRIHLLGYPGFGPFQPDAHPFYPLAPWWFVALFAVCVNVAAQIGDLTESALKRGAGVKDSGTLLPGHGGVLDRIDALLFALPVGMVFYVAGMARYFNYLTSVG